MFKPLRCNDAQLINDFNEFDSWYEDVVGKSLITARCWDRCLEFSTSVQIVMLLLALHLMVAMSSILDASLPLIQIVAATLAYSVAAIVVSEIFSHKAWKRRELLLDEASTRYASLIERYNAKLEDIIE